MLPFLHSRHLHFDEQGIDAWKHSQYFFRQWDLRQLHPFACEMPTPPSTSPPPAAVVAATPAAEIPLAGDTTVLPSSVLEITWSPAPKAPGKKRTAEGAAFAPDAAADDSAAAAAVPGCATFGRNAFGLRSRMCSIARCLVSSLGWLFWQLAHWQVGWK